MSSNSTGQADLVFLGNAWTAAGDPAIVTHAVAVAGGRIAAVGDNAAAMAATAGAVIEVGDGLLLPGFGDGHAHPVFAGIEALFAPVRHQTDVAASTLVEKDQPIGKSGMTGLAGGDHLHFTMLVNGRMVNPVEWWDSHWIEDRILRKLRAAAQ